MAEQRTVAAKRASGVKASVLDTREGERCRQRPETRDKIQGRVGVVVGCWWHVRQEGVGFGASGDAKEYMCHTNYVFESFRA